ncbi:DUF6923 family protein [Oerskovia turbata]
MRRLTSMMLAGVLALGTMVGVMLGAAAPAQAAPGDPFPVGPGLVWVAQGTARGEPTRLYQAVQGSGNITFVPQGPAYTIGYNAISLHESDMYLYAINDNNRLLRIGQEGAVTNLGVVGLPLNTALNFNQAAFGEGVASDILFTRLAQTDQSLYAVNVVSRTTTRIQLSANVPNLSDMVWSDGYLWGLYGEGGRLYRMDPVTGAVLSVPVTGLPANPYGAQWVYGNGNIGVSNNITGRVYQFTINNPTSNAPSITLVSSQPGPANTQNDGASYRGLPVDLAITKSADPITVTPGGQVVYSLTVTNNGPGDSSGYVVTDALPAQFTNPTTTTPGCAITGQQVTCAGGPLASGGTALIQVVGTSSATTACFSNAASVTGNESDPSLVNNTSNTTVCPPEVTPPTFSVAKTASVATPAFVDPGDSVTYTVTVTNTGQTAFTDADPASFSDILANVLDDATVTAGPTVTTGGGTATFDTTTGTIGWSGPLPVGGTATITYTVTVNQPDTGDHLLTNAVVPGGHGECVSAAACAVDTPVAGFTVAKTASVAQAAPGDVVTYSVVVTNVGQVAFGGTEGATTDPAGVTDSLASVLPYAAYNDDASGGGTLNGDVLSWAVDLPIGATVTLTYSVTVDPEVEGPATLVNLVVPGDHGACAPASACETDTPISGYVVSKTASAESVDAGDPVTYTITVRNTGAAAYTVENPAGFSDDLAGVLDDATYNGDATNGAVLSGTTLTWSGPLDVGASVTVTFSLTVNAPDTGDHLLRNAVVPTGGDGQCDPALTCETETPVAAFAVSKTASATTADPGSPVTYTVTVRNTGAVAYTVENPAGFSDDLSAVLDDATYNGDATNGAVLSGTTLTWSGPLDIGASATVTFTVTVRSPDPGDRTLRNVVVPTGGGGFCDPDLTCVTETTVPGPTPPPAPKPAPPKGSLSATGGDPLPMLGMSAALLLAGAGTIWARRRMRSGGRHL